MSNHTSTGLMHRVVETPKYGRAISLLFAGLLTYLAVISAQTWLAQVEERIGALGWTLFSEKEREERITLVVIDEKKFGRGRSLAMDPRCNGSARQCN